MNSSRADYRIMVAIETDATRYHGAASARPRLLPKAEAEQMLAHLAADLRVLLPRIHQCSIMAAGALFDQTQLLRADYPVFAGLQQLMAHSGARETPGLVSVGGTGGKMPLDELQPEEEIPLGLLQLLPVLIEGPAAVVEELGMAMEHRFMEEGQVSAHTATALESLFGIAIRHARFMTLTDLNAMFRLQLEHFGFLPLWQLLDAALNQVTAPVTVTATGGQVWEWQDGAVHTLFETFDDWSREGSGRTLESVRGRLAGGYAEWTRVIRQYLTTLTAHRVPVAFHPADRPGEPLTGSFCVEESTISRPEHCAEVTEHSFAELGTVCITLVRDGRQKNYYPLAAAGLLDIQRHIRQCGLASATVSYPGSILYDERSRRLVAESNLPGTMH